MADAIYEVNIKLNAQNFEAELNALKKKLERFVGVKKSGGLFQPEPGNSKAK